MTKFDDDIKEIEDIYLDHNEHTHIDDGLYYTVFTIEPGAFTGGTPNRIYWDMQKKCRANNTAYLHGSLCEVYSTAEAKRICEQVLTGLKEGITPNTIKCKCVGDVKVFTLFVPKRNEVRVVIVFEEASDESQFLDEMAIF